MQIMHDDFQLPGEDGGDGVRWHVNDIRRIHVYERCSQFSILQQLPSAYMWACLLYTSALRQAVRPGLCPLLHRLAARNVTRSTHVKAENTVV